MIMLNQKRVDRIVSCQKCLHQRKGGFLDWILGQCKSRWIWDDEGGNSNEQACRKPREARAMLKRGWGGDWGMQNEVDAMECKDVVKMKTIEDGRCGMNGGKSSCALIIDGWVRTNCWFHINLVILLLILILFNKCILSMAAVISTYFTKMSWCLYYLENPSYLGRFSISEC